MKKLILFITFNVLLSIPLYGHSNISNTFQDTTSVTTNPASLGDIKLDDIKKDIAELRELIEKNAGDSLSVVGVLRIKEWDNIPFTIQNYRSNQQQIKAEHMLRIEKITLLIKDGYMNDVQIFTKNGSGELLKFSNSQAPIGITTNRLDKGDWLTHRKAANQYYTINTNDFWDYEGFGSYSPRDGIISYTREKYHKYKEPEKNGIKLYRDVGINSVFDIRFYTDLLATFGRESSGLAQTDASFRHIIHRSNYWNTGFFPPFQYVKFNLSLKKFDSQFSSTAISDFNRNIYLQRSWLTSDISTSLISVWIEKKSLSSFFIDTGASLNLSDIEEDNESKTTSSYGFFIDPGLDLRVADNLTINITNRFLWHYSPETDFDNQGKRTPFMISGLDLSWNPLGDNAGRIFGRISYVSNLNGENNNFYQFQTGYRLRLTDLTKGT